ncbi:MAG TPA: hypothetical protein VMF91_05160 [Bryobacteraceae bacterium]|nr:hypothetical protein [Bryobacteraceae bacterium]
MAFAFGAGVWFTSNIINERQAAQLRQFDKDLTGAKSELGKQQERAANAERSLLELRERIKPRHLTDKEAAAFVAALRTHPGGTSDFGTTIGGGDEAANFAKQLLPLFRQAGWKAPEDISGTTNHLDIQVVGIGILTPGTETPDHRAATPYVRLTPALMALRDAFRSVGMEAQFIAWHPKTGDVPEVVIGSKPQPKP